MNTGVKKLSTAVRLALTLGAAIAVGTSGTALAQDAAQGGQAAQDQAQTLKAVVVTGSRLPSVTITASSPVTTIDAQALTVTGTTSVDQLVNQLPQLSPYFDQFQNNGATGYPTADLRGLGTNRTLVLIDGQRVQAGSATGGPVDLSQVPSALVQRVDILTGGASAVYGADAVAGVVNFVLNHDFEGVQFDYKLSGYSHDNRNKYMQGLEADANYPYPTGNSGFNGKTREADAIFGGHFSDGDGHAMGWVSAQKTDAVLSDVRDYSACSLGNSGLSCGGSGTAANPNFIAIDHAGTNGEVHMDPGTGAWVNGAATPYNYAPSNYYQRPGTRINLGASIKYHINDAFEPYMDAMYQHRRSEFQLAPSGAFFEQVDVDCATATGAIGNFCSQVVPMLGLDASQPLAVQVGKRNVEGGPRRSAVTNDTYRFVVGARGDISTRWSYDVSGVMGETTNLSVGTGDFLSDRVVPAILGCPAGSYSGCVPYNVWQPNAITQEAVEGLGGVSLRPTRTRLMDMNAFVRGDLGVALPWAGADTISMVFGTEWRKQDLSSTADSNSQQGNFSGAGGPTLPIKGQIQVKEAYTEWGVPIISDMGMLKSLAADLGYRYSDYKNMGTTNTYKIGLNANLNDVFRLRGGYNRAARAPNINELFATQQIGLFSGSDPCAGATPADTAAQCANTGVTAAQYGHVIDNPASQYNEFTGGNPNLVPEKADTYTFGFAVTPLQGLEATLDYYEVKIKDTIGTIGANTTLDLCAKTGNPFLCDNVKRNPATGDLWLGQTGQVINLTNNFGNQKARGIDLNASYVWRMFGGRAQASLAGSRLLSLEKDPLPGVNSDAVYDCAGKINTSCNNPPSPKWRHLVNLNYQKDWWSVNVRWRYFGQVRYVNNDGTFATTDKLLFNHDHKISAYNWLDVSGTFHIGTYVDLTVGVNNITDRAPPLVGGSLVDNANTPGGYDELGRYYFTNVSVRF